MILDNKGKIYRILKSKWFIGLILILIGIFFVFIPFYVRFETGTCLTIIIIGCIVFFIGFRFLTLSPDRI